MLAGPATSTPAVAPKGLVQKGITYDSGTISIGAGGVPEAPSREGWSDEVTARTAMRREIDVIRDELKCAAISILGSDVARLTDGAAMALERGFHVWLQPRLMGAASDDTLNLLSEVARSAEQLRMDSPNIGVNVGVEATLFTGGIIPGDSFEERVASLIAAGNQLPAFNRNLNVYLERAVAATRASFGGEVTYSAGPWEWGEIEWSRFDVVGLDSSMDASNEATYVSAPRALRRHGKPFVVTEFVCCCYEGAENRGGDGYDIVDWAKPLPELNGAYVRSEQTQAGYLAKLLAIYEAEGVHGAFVWTFIEDSPYSPDPASTWTWPVSGSSRPCPTAGTPLPSARSPRPPAPTPGSRR